MAARPSGRAIQRGLAARCGPQQGWRQVLERQLPVGQVAARNVDHECRLAVAGRRRAVHAVRWNATWGPQNGYVYTACPNYQGETVYSGVTIGGEPGTLALWNGFLFSDNTNSAIDNFGNFQLGDGGGAVVTTKDKTCYVDIAFGQQGGWIYYDDSNGLSGGTQYGGSNGSTSPR